MANIDNLFKIMAEKRVSQKELAVAINASTGNVSDWKKGRSFPSAQKLDEAATFLECSVDYLLGRTDEPNGYNNISNIDTTINGTQTNGNYNNIHIQTESKKAYSEMIEHLESLSSSEKRHAVADLMDILEEKYPKKK